MRKVYEASGEEKESIIDFNNEHRAFEKVKNKDVGVKDLMMITRLKDFPENGSIDARWSINGITSNNNEQDSILVFEPFAEQLSNNLSRISPTSTRFSSPIKLSDKAIILMPVSKYEGMIKNPETKKALKKFTVRLYEGEEELAVKMLMYDKEFVYLPLGRTGYNIDKKKHADLAEFAGVIKKGQRRINRQIWEEEIVKPYTKRKKKITHEANEKRIDEQQGDYRIITGLTDDVEGDVFLDDEMSASTDIGKKRDNQEDAVLLIRNAQNPDFKMMVVADGMGGCSSGEVASHIIVDKLKEWFETLTEEQKASYNTSVGELTQSLIDKIELDVQPSVEMETWKQGGSTLVCAIIGKNDTLIVNVGDSRAYMVQDGKLVQVSREDTETQIHLEEGRFPNKEASRFDKHSHILIQSIGMSRNMLMHPYSKVISNDDYDMLLLFTDGVTDCLSDDDIVAVCKNTDKKELAGKIVEKAIRHDSFIPEEYADYRGVNKYIPGGKDNATAAVCSRKRGRRANTGREEEQR